MKVFGLTGGIGCGKSTVANMLRLLGHEVIDADQVARDVVRPGGAGLAGLTAEFGAEILDREGGLDRRLLATRVFGDEEARARLNALLHPLIAAESARRLAELAARGLPFAFYEAALLVENQVHLGLAGLIVVIAAPAIRRARVLARDGLSEDEFERRLAAQASDTERARVANLVLDNSGSLEDLRKQVRSLHERLVGGEALPPPEIGGAPGSTPP